LLNQRPDFQIKAIYVVPNILQLAKENNPNAEFEEMDYRNGLFYFSFIEGDYVNSGYEIGRSGNKAYVCLLSSRNLFQKSIKRTKL